MKPTSVILYRERGFLQEDLSCCADGQCVIEQEETETPEVHDYEKATFA